MNRFKDPYYIRSLLATVITLGATLAFWLMVTYTTGIVGLVIISLPILIPLALFYGGDWISRNRKNRKKATGLKELSESDGERF